MLISENIGRYAILIIGILRILSILQIKLLLKVESNPKR